jgi:hypothetical protein
MSAPFDSNDVTGLFETLVAPASATAAQVAKFNNPMLQSCYNDYDSTYGSIGNTLVINIPIVNIGNVTNIGDGALSIVATNQTTQTLQIAYNASSSRRIQSFDQIRTPVQLRRLYLDGMIEEVTRYVDNVLVQIALGNAATVAAPGITAPSPNSFFATNTPIATVGTGSTIGMATQTGEFTRLQLASAWATLIGQGADMTPQNGFFITNQVPYGAMLGDPNLQLIQAYVVGESEAEKAQQTARFAPFLNSTINYDQFIGQTSSSATPASKYYGLMFHRYAIGFKPVLQPKTQSPVVEEMTVFPKENFPVRVQLGYDLVNQGWILAVNTIFAANVIRPEFGEVVYSS